MTVHEFQEIHEAWAEVMAAYTVADEPFDAGPEEMAAAFGQGAAPVATAR